MTVLKADLWAEWVEDTLLEDIHTPERPDPVPFLTTEDGDLETTDELDRYRYGKNNGEYACWSHHSPGKGPRL